MEKFVICEEIIRAFAAHLRSEERATDAINAIEGAPVSDYARALSCAWANGEITGEQMKDALLASHRKLAERVSGKLSTMSQRI